MYISRLLFFSHTLFYTTSTPPLEKLPLNYKLFPLFIFPSSFLLAFKRRVSFGGFSSHLTPGLGGGGGGSGALGALALGLAPGGGLARGHSPMGHILEGAVGVVERRKRSAGELSGGLGAEAHLSSFAFSGRAILSFLCLIFSFYFYLFLFLHTPKKTKRQFLLFFLRSFFFFSSFLVFFPLLTFILLSKTSLSCLIQLYLFLHIMPHLSRLYRLSPSLLSPPTHPLIHGNISTCPN